MAYGEEDFVFDSRTVPERTSFISEGEHDCVIANAEVKSVSTGRLVEVSVDVQGKLIKIGQWIEHSNDKAVLIGCQNLRDCFISAFGADKKEKISALVGRPARVLLKKGPLKDGKQYLEIDRWLPRVGGSNAPAQRQAPKASVTTKPSEDDVPFS